MYKKEETVMKKLNQYLMAHMSRILRILGAYGLDRMPLPITLVSNLVCGLLKVERISITKIRQHGATLYVCMNIALLFS